LQEEHGRFAVSVVALDLGHGVEALEGESFGQERQEVGDGALTGELVIAGVQESFDGLLAEDAVELAAQVGGGGDVTFNGNFWKIQPLPEGVRLTLKSAGARPNRPDRIAPMTYGIEFHPAR
jgi:hypothetical protein